VPQTLRVVQLNIGSLIETDWDSRRHEIVAWLEKLAPDVVCLQEVWESEAQDNTAGWIADELSKSGTAEWHWAFGGFGVSAFIPDPTLLFGSAVLSRWPIEHSEAWRLPFADGAPKIVSLIPWELLHVRTAGIDFFSTHMSPAPTDGLHRILQVEAIDDHIKAVRGDKDAHVFGSNRQGMPAILCGDFNAEPDSDEIRFLTSLSPLNGKTTFYQDAWRVAGQAGPGYTQVWRDNPTSAELNLHRKRIDYVFVGDAFKREGSAGRVLDCEIVFNTKITGVMASDHSGLCVDVLWPDRLD
jgi:endonuclease/exonuclease/phosphatase family metal-dependent hydrolase